ncbi:hypothetical protein ACTFIZ_001316 [Dictyostelium cf. discoideum]
MGKKFVTPNREKAKNNSSAIVISIMLPSLHFKLNEKDYFVITKMVKTVAFSVLDRENSRDSNSLGCRESNGSNSTNSSSLSGSSTNKKKKKSPIKLYVNGFTRGQNLALSKIKLDIRFGGVSMQSSDSNFNININGSNSTQQPFLTIQEAGQPTVYFQLNLGENYSLQAIKVAFISTIGIDLKLSSVLFSPSLSDSTFESTPFIFSDNGGVSSGGSDVSNNKR